MEAQVRKASPRYSALTQPLPATLQEIRSEVLDDDTLLLEYMFGPEGGHVWAVTTTELLSAPLPAAATIESAARRMVERMTARQRGGSPATLARADAQLGTATARLSRLLLAPFAQRLSGAWKGRRLLVVSSGALAYVPFGVLPVPGRPGQQNARVAVSLSGRWWSCLCGAGARRCSPKRSIFSSSPLRHGRSRTTAPAGRCRHACRSTNTPKSGCGSHPRRRSSSCRSG